jgi:uncharacterized protein YecE (DUF72 family)
VAGKVRIGISGWRYAGWRGVFYPPKLPQRSELAFAAKNFNSIEINGTHYSLQRPEYFAQWAAETPEDFAFAVKGSRFITHMKKLRDVEDALANFFAQGILCLGKKLGPVLWQFPPRFVFAPVKLARDFLQNATADDEASSSARCRTWAEVAWPGPYNSGTGNYKARDPALCRNSAREFCCSGVHSTITAI